MKLEVNYIFHQFIASNINMGGKGAEECWEQINSEALSTLQPAKMPVSNEVSEISKLLCRYAHFIRTTVSDCT